MPSPRRVVVAGGGLAAVRLVQALREQDRTTALVVLAAEPHLPYDRPPLSKQVLRGQPGPEVLLDDAAAAELDVDLRLGCRAVAADCAARTVLTADGTTLAYDELVVATGASPRHLPDLAGPAVHVLRTREDGEHLGREVRAAGRVTVVGGGFLGCEVASSARDLGAQVVLLEVLALPLVRVLGPEVAEQLLPLQRRAGVDVRPATSVTAVHGEGPDRRLSLSDGSTVSGSPALVAVGVDPDTAWLAGSGVELDGGVLCDASGRTNVPGVWAAGDVARWELPGTHEHRRLEHWTSAAEQAGVVAANLCGHPVVHDPVPYVWSEQFGVTLQVVGLPAADDQVALLRVGPAADRLVALYHRDGRLTGALGVSAPRWVSRLRRLLAGGSSYEQARKTVIA